MKNRTTVALALIAGFGLGAVSIHTLHAQAKPPAFAIIETDVKDNARYVKEYAPKAQALARQKGGKVLAASSSVVTLEGAQAKRVAIVQYANMDQLKAWHGSPEFKQIRKQGDQLASFRILALDGLPQP